jgi:hypothetical protein
VSHLSPHPNPLPKEEGEWKTGRGYSGSLLSPHPNPLPKGGGIEPAPQPSPKGRGRITTRGPFFVDAPSCPGLYFAAFSRVFAALVFEFFGSTFHPDLRRATKQPSHRALASVEVVLMFCSHSLLSFSSAIISIRNLPATTFLTRLSARRSTLACVSVQYSSVRLTPKSRYMPDILSFTETPNSRAEAAHNRAEGAHNRAEGAHNRAAGAHNRAAGAHGRAEGAHNRAAGAHGRAEAAHGRAAGAHGRAEAAHGWAEAAHSRAEAAHGCAEAAHGWAEAAHGWAEAAHGRAAGAHGRAEAVHSPERCAQWRAK